MPLYDYQCQNQTCQHTFEAQHPMAGPEPDQCPECHAANPKRLITFQGAVTVSLTGQDWKNAAKIGAKNLIKESQNNEKLAANLTGEDKYQKDRTTAERIQKKLNIKD